jgi:hypothetical protein
MLSVRRLPAVLAALCAGAVTHAQGAPGSAQDFDYARVDSLVLERPYDRYVLHPAYRLTITREGEVRYVAGERAPHRAAPASIAPEAFQVLMAHAVGARFAQLPDSIMRDQRFCPVLRTDAARITVTLYLPDSAKRVANYHGCVWTPAALRDFEQAIERAAGVDPYGPRR